MKCADMKSIKVTNLGEIRNELNKYKKGKKFDIHQFNQIARLAWLGKIVMQPLDPEKKPKVHEPKLNHVGLWVDDLPKAVEWMTEKGVRFTPGGIRPGASGFDVCFVHPKANDEFPLSSEGVLVELVQAPDEVIQAKS